MRHAALRGMGKRRIVLLCLGILAAVGAVAAAVSIGRRGGALAPVVLQDAGPLDPGVARLVEAGVAEVRRNPGSAEAHGALGMVYEANGFSNQAAECYARAEALAPQDARWPYRRAILEWQFGKVRSALDMLSKLVAAHPDSAAIQHRYGEYLLQSGDDANAEAAFERTIELAPHAPQGYVGVANLRLRGGDGEAARQLLEKAVALDPNYKPARYLLGLAYRALGRSEAAMRELKLGEGAHTEFLPEESTLQLASFAVNPADLVADARRLVMAGRPREAAELLESARRTRPGDLSILNNLGALYLDANAPERALRPLVEAERVDPAFPGTHLNLATCLLRLDRPEEALEHSRRAVELAPELPQALLVHVDVLWRLDRLDEALHFAEKAGRLDPNNPAAHVKLGRLCEGLGRLEAAESHYRRVVELLPDAAEAHAQLAGVLLRLSRIEEATAALADAERLNPEHPQVVALARELAKSRKP